MDPMIVVPAPGVLQFPLTRSASEVFFVGSYVLSLLLCWYLPATRKRQHVTDQRRILDRCRALLLAGTRAIEGGDEIAAQHALRRIRRLERHWRLGNRLLFQAALAVWAIGIGVAACISVRLLANWTIHYAMLGEGITPEGLVNDIRLSLALSITAPLWAFVGYLESPKEYSLNESCGDRLSQLLYGARDIALREDLTDANMPDFGRMSPHQIFDVGVRFTLRELNRSRRQLVRQLHPDRWYAATPNERRLREETLKTVNAAYDFLRQQAS